MQTKTSNKYWKFSADGSNYVWARQPLENFFKYAEVAQLLFLQGNKNCFVNKLLK